MSFFLILSFFAGQLLPVALAAGNQFTIGVVVTSDATPPSIPAGLGATPISSSQINLAWTASTDNVAVAGYVVRRGGVAIATTTLVTYSDTGLTASTLYSYTVEAFDASNNYSGQSGPASATTNGGGPPPPPPDTTPPTIGSLNPLNGASGVAATTTLRITFSENVAAMAGTIYVKKQSDASIVETIPSNSGQVVVSGSLATITLSAPLLSATQYYVEITATAIADIAGNLFAGISGSGTWSFTIFDNTPPVISAVSATSTYTTGTVVFTTNKSAIGTMEWGTTTAYAGGSASEIVYGLAHSIGVGSLATNTLYYFRITAKDISNNISIAYTGSFTTQNPPPPPDTTPPANPSAFSATPSLTTISLSWVNPPDVDFQAVRILRRVTGYPANPTDGVLVYEGSAQSVIDTGRATGTLYYYTAFARDAALNYSSGSIVSATTDTGIIPPPPPETCFDGIMNQNETGIDTGGVCAAPPPPPSATCYDGIMNQDETGIDTGGVCTTPPPPPGGTGSTTPPTPIFPPITSTTSGPFINFPATGTPSAAILAITLNDFIFTQVGATEVVLPQRNGIVRTNGEKNVRVSINYNKLPDVLKTIAITITDPNQRNKELSYLLNVNKSKTVYEGVIPIFTEDGRYPFTISIVDHENKGIARLLGIFDVYLPIKLPSIIPPAIAQAVNQAIEDIQVPVQNIAPIAAPIGVAIGAGQAVLLATNVGSVYDIYLLILKLIGLITGIFRRKRHEPWGVVYDSVTKRPLDPAYVIAQVRDTQKSKGEAITDLDGRYGFLLNPGEYVIVANKTHYKFPSDKLKGRARDEFYENLYFGDPFQVREGGAVTYNIPLDPVEFDWNEFAKNQDQVFQVYSKRANIRMWIFNIIFYIGFVFSSLTLFLSPSALNVFVVVVYVGIIGFQIFWRATHKVTRVLNRITKKPIPFALIKVWLPGLNTVVKKTVTDETGKFYFLIPPGTYFITIEEKLPDGTYHEVLRTKDLALTKGVVSEDFLI